jgi:hypothetical protein
LAAQEPGHDDVVHPRRPHRQFVGAAGAQHQDVGGALSQRGAVRDRFGHTGVDEPAARHRDRRSGQHRHARRRGERDLDRVDVGQERVQVGGLAGVGVGGERVEGDRVGQDRREVHRFEHRVDLVDEVFEVDHRAAAQGVQRVDDPAHDDRVPPGADAGRRPAAEEPGAVQRAGR